MLATSLGVVNAFDVPARQSFIIEMVGREDLLNAIALNSSMYNGARVIGPAIAGILIASIGEGWCFFANGISYIAVITGLFMMRVDATGTSAYGFGVRKYRGGIPLCTAGGAGAGDFADGRTRELDDDAGDGADANFRGPHFAWRRAEPGLADGFGWDRSAVGRADAGVEARSDGIGALGVGRGHRRGDDADSFCGVTKFVAVDGRFWAWRDLRCSCKWGRATR